MPKSISQLEKTLDIKFKNKDLLLEAVVHRSYINEHRGFKLDHNERLEFLGDAVLELIVTEYLFKKYPNPEGDLTNWRASLVNSVSLTEVSKRIDLEKYMLLSKGEAQDKSKKARDSILANAVEAIIGAIYLDQGIRASTKFINRFFISKLDYILENKLFEDPKSTFQEMAQDKTGITPHYKVLSETGPDHNRHFKIGVLLKKETIAIGEGSSKQEAQVAAAQKALEKKGWK